MNTSGSHCLSQLHSMKRYSLAPQGIAVPSSIPYGTVPNLSLGKDLLSRQLYDSGQSHSMVDSNNTRVPVDGIRGHSGSSRRTHPVAIPNLTKKARGRQVPTKDVVARQGGGDRSFVCSVESCQKVFTRSEHLKRHTLSIHTNERPFQCAEPECGKFFTRHDNLLQHQRSHKGSPAHSGNASSDISGPLDRVYNLRDPLVASPSDSGTMGMLLPSPLTTVPMASTHTTELARDIQALDDRYVPQIAGTSTLPVSRKELDLQPSHTPCYFGESQLRPRYQISAGLVLPPPQLIHVSIPISKLTEKQSAGHE